MGGKALDVPHLRIASSLVILLELEYLSSLETILNLRINSFRSLICMTKLNIGIIQMSRGPNFITAILKINLKGINIWEILIGWRILILSVLRIRIALMLIAMETLYLIPFLVK